MSVNYVFPIIKNKDIIAYDLIPLVILVVSLMESILVLVFNRSINRVKTIVLTILFNIVCFYLPFSFYRWEWGFNYPDWSEQKRTFLKHAAFISPLTVCFKAFLNVFIEYHVLKDECDNKKKLSVSLLVINMITILLAFLAQFLLFDYPGI